MKGILKSAPASLSPWILQEKADLRRVVREREQPAVPITKSKPTSLQESKAGEGRMAPKKKEHYYSFTPRGKPSRALAGWKFTFQIQEGRAQSSTSCLGAGGSAGWGNLAGTKGSSCCLTSQPRGPKKGGKGTSTSSPAAFHPSQCCCSLPGALGKETPSSPNASGTGELGGWVGSDRLRGWHSRLRG